MAQKEKISVYIMYLTALIIPIIIITILTTPFLSYALEFKPVSSNINPYMQIRARYEYVDDKIHKPANASTVRTVLGSNFDQLFDIKNLDFHFELTNVSTFDRGLYKFYNNGWRNEDRSLVADPPMTRITQLYGNFTLYKTTFFIGRKFLSFDNQRFIGDIGWRQMPQSFGVIGIEDETIPNLKFTGAYLYEKRSVMENLNSNWRHNSGKAPILLNVSYTFSPELKIVGYDYMITDKHDTLGLRLLGKLKLWDSDFSLAYEIEGAYQRHPTRGEADANANYFDAMLKFFYKGIIIGGGYEILGSGRGDGNPAFCTPFATLHKFNGWSDVLLKQAASGRDSMGHNDGLEDVFGIIGYKGKTMGNLFAIYHDFSSDEHGYDYGNELDLLYVRNVGFVDKNLSFLVKAAFYNSGEDVYSNDVTKIWIMLTYNFQFLD